MKKYFYLFVCMMFSLISCDDDDKLIPTYPVSFQVSYEDDAIMQELEGLEINLTSNTGATFLATTDSVGKAVFVLPVGIYEASVTTSKPSEGYLYHFNGLKSGITVSDTWNSSQITEIKIVTSRSGQVVIKELYNGGCQKDDGSGKYIDDSYFIL